MKVRVKPRPQGQVRTALAVVAGVLIARGLEALGVAPAAALGVSEAIAPHATEAALGAGLYVAAAAWSWWAPEKRPPA